MLIGYVWGKVAYIPSVNTARVLRVAMLTLVSNILINLKDNVSLVEFAKVHNIFAGIVSSI